jgi:hypothetical protein
MSIDSLTISLTPPTFAVKAVVIAFRLAAMTALVPTSAFTTKILNRKGISQAQFVE